MVLRIRLPGHDGEVARDTAEFLDRLEEGAGETEIAGEGTAVAIFHLHKAKLLVKGHQPVHAAEPDGRRLVGQKLPDDLGRNTLSPPLFLHGNGSQFPRAISVAFDLPAADQRSVFIYGHQKPLPFQPYRVDVDGPN